METVEQNARRFEKDPEAAVRELQAILREIGRLYCSRLDEYFFDDDLHWCNVLDPIGGTYDQHVTLADRLVRFRRVLGLVKQLGGGGEWSVFDQPLLSRVSSLVCEQWTSENGAELSHKVSQMKASLDAFQTSLDSPGEASELTTAKPDTKEPYRQQVDQFLSALHTETGRDFAGEETSEKDSALPKGELVCASIEEAELTAVEERWKSLWTAGTASEDELADGTNLPAGANYSWELRKSESWFSPSTVRENPHWRQTLGRLSERMKAIQMLGKRFPVCLEQHQIPDLGGMIKPQKEPSHPSGNGLDLEPVHLKPQVPVVPSFAFPGAEGNPIATSIGEPYPFRLGFSRTHSVEGASGEDLQLFSDAAKVLTVLPAFVNEVLWKRWRQGFRLPEEGFDEGVWIDAVFETSWQQLPYSSLRASRKALSSDGNTSVVLKGEGLFPRIPPIPAFRSMVPNVQGYPQRIRSKLPDLLESSIQLIETILAIPGRPVVDSQSLQFDREHCETCPTTAEQRELVKLIASEQNRISTDDDRLKSFTEGSLQTLIVNRFLVRREGYFECTPNGLHLFQLMAEHRVGVAPEKAHIHFQTKDDQNARRGSSVMTIDEICIELHPGEGRAQRKARKNLKELLTLLKTTTAAAIAREKRNKGIRGFSESTISEKLTELKKRFGDRLPDELR